eukprot:scaffold193623_cov22-Prasinocladus_malaysianus.AAC.2
MSVLLHTLFTGANKLDGGLLLCCTLRETSCMCGHGRQGLHASLHISFNSGGERACCLFNSCAE